MHVSLCLVAFFSFNALPNSITIVWRFADASRGAFNVLAFFWNLWHAADEIDDWTVTTGDAILGGTAIAVDFTISWTLISWWRHTRYTIRARNLSDHTFLIIAIGFQYAYAIRIPEISFLTEASNDAITAAEWTRMWIFARWWANAAA